MQLYPVAMGVCTSYLIHDDGLLLVDAGQQGYGHRISATLTRLGLAPSDLKLIFLTHGHWDHIGALNELRAMTTAPAAINHREKAWVEQGLKPFPPAITAWGEVVAALLKTFVVPRQTFGPVAVEIALDDEPFSLKPYGVNGEAYPTPGHSSGSMSLLLATGEALVGDLAVNGGGLRLGPNASAFAEDARAIPASWRLLLDKGAKVIYPAHGKPFPAGRLHRLLRD